MKATNIGNRTVVVDGKNIPVGETVELPDNADVMYHVSRGYLRIGDVKLKEAPKSSKFDELMKKSMNELREIGDKVGAKDTKKSELVEEIIEKGGY